MMVSRAGSISGYKKTLLRFFGLIFFAEVQIERVREILKKALAEAEEASSYWIIWISLALGLSQNVFPKLGK